jgi:hypothetical protein
MDGWVGGWMDGWMDGRKEEREEVLDDKSFISWVIEIYFPHGRYWDEEIKKNEMGGGGM